MFKYPHQLMADCKWYRLSTFWGCKMNQQNSLNVGGKEPNQMLNLILFYFYFQELSLFPGGGRLVHLHVAEREVMIGEKIWPSGIAGNIWYKTISTLNSKP